MEILPHRYPFLLVDRVLELQPGTPRRGDQEREHQRTVLRRDTGRDCRSCRACSILEALAQAAGILIAASVDRPGGSR